MVNDTPKAKNKTKSLVPVVFVFLGNLHIGVYTNEELICKILSKLYHGYSQVTGTFVTPVYYFNRTHI